MAYPTIRTPRGEIVVNQATLKAEINWNPDFVNRWAWRYDEVQKFVDAEVVRLCEPYTPLLTGMLVKSSLLGTDVGSGEVAWIAPYASAQYYSDRAPGSETGPLRGPQWFERMKASHWDEIVDGARAVMQRESASE